MSNVAFTIREEFRPRPDAEGNETNRDAVHGAVIGLPPDARSYDVVKALGTNRPLQDGGLIVASEETDAYVVQALRSLSWLVETDVPQDAGISAPAVAERVRYDELRKGELEQIVVDRGIIVPDSPTKAQLVEALIRADEPAANEPPQPGAPTDPDTPSQEG